MSREGARSILICSETERFLATHSQQGSDFPVCDLSLFCFHLITIYNIHIYSSHSYEKSIRQDLPAKVYYKDKGALCKGNSRISSPTIPTYLSGMEKFILDL